MMIETAQGAFAASTRQNTVAVAPAAPLIARILLAAIFLLSGLGKLAAVKGTQAMMAGAHMPAVPFFFAAALAFEVLGGLSVMFGFHARLGAAALIVFLIPATLIFHNFWAAQGMAQQMQMANFLKNVPIMGGLGLIIAYGAGPISLDARRARKQG